jgi:hypothetical protein
VGVEEIRAHLDAQGPVLPERLLDDLQVGQVLPGLEPPG